MIFNNSPRTIEDWNRYMQSTPDIYRDETKSCESCHYSGRDIYKGWFCKFHNRVTMWSGSCSDYVDARKL